MNILLFAEDFMLNGVTRHIIDLANGLHHRGHTIVVASSTSSEEKRLDPAIPFLPLSLCYPSSYTKNYTGLVRSIILLSRAVRQYDIQLIHTHKRYADAIGRLVARRRGIVHVSTCHNEFSTMTRCSFFGDRTITPCESIAWMLVERFHRRPITIDIIPYGIPELPQVPPEKNEKTRTLYKIDGKTKVILSVGHLNRQKDRLTLLEAIRILHESGRFSDVKLLIVGEGEESFVVHSFIRQHHLEHFVMILPAKSDIVALNNIAEFGVLSSLHETWAYVLLEAASIGKPYVATSVGCIPSFMDENTNGLCVPQQNPQKLAEAIADLLEHREKVETFGKMARKRYEKHHTYDQFLETTIATYQRSLSQS